MKKYIAPKTVVYKIEVTEVIAGSGGFIPIDTNPSTDFAPEIRRELQRGSDWDEYEQ